MHKLRGRVFQRNTTTRERIQHWMRLRVVDGHRSSDSVVGARCISRRGTLFARHQDQTTRTGKRMDFIL